MPTDAALNQFLDFLRFGSISTDSKYKDQVLGCAEWLKKKLNAIGLEGDPARDARPSDHRRARPAQERDGRPS